VTGVHNASDLWGGDVTTHVSNVRASLATAASIVLESFTVDKKSPTSILIIDGVISGWGANAGVMQQGWKYGDAPFANDGHTDSRPFNVYNPNDAHDSAVSSGQQRRIAQTQSVYTVTEVEP
jgi:hypothetical protein